MSQPNEPKIIMPDLPINKKFGNAKFEQIFDPVTIDRSEKTVDQSQEVFKSETTNDYDNLKKSFAKLPAGTINRDALLEFSELAFSIKSRAATGGLPLASEIANSMYKFCDAAYIHIPEDAYSVIKLHIDALVQVFEHGFAADNNAMAKKLVRGLEDVVHKFLGK